MIDKFRNMECTIELKKDGEMWSYEIKSTIMPDKVVKFKSGEEVVTDFMGNDVKVKILRTLMYLNTMFLLLTTWYTVSHGHMPQVNGNSEPKSVLENLNVCCFKSILGISHFLKLPKSFTIWIYNEDRSTYFRISIVKIIKYNQKIIGLLTARCR